MSPRPKKAALYVRVSTADQTIENPVTKLERVAEFRGWRITNRYSDRGISGAKGRHERPGLDAMLKDAGQGRFDVVMAWSLDRLGRSLIDLLQTVEHLDGVGVDLYLMQQHIDTTTAAGKLLFQITGAFVEFERATIRERVKAGMGRARAELAKNGKYIARCSGIVRRSLGRPGAEPEKLENAKELLAQGEGRAGAGATHLKKPQPMFVTQRRSRCIDRIVADPAVGHSMLVPAKINVTLWVSAKSTAGESAPAPPFGSVSRWSK
jgi:DNA invertase Pin-like site-specific DNA recombinase